MRRTFVSVLALVLVLAMALPAAAGGGKDGKTHHGKKGKDVVDVVLKVSGTKGFDRNPRDYDLLRKSLVVTGLVGALKDASGITVWAPKDLAFKRLARDLGWKGRGERSAFRFLKKNVGGDLLTDVLLYHVSPKKFTAKEVVRLAKKHRPVPTLLDDATFRVTRSLRLIDNEPDLRNPRLVPPLNIKASNGIIHTINRVLIPADL